ncbi:MAG: AAA family ATPase [Chloroflexi bacterium]|nr:AAA family ATPase [Chloroflexota bacterium]
MAGSPRSACQHLIDWANQQDGWIKAIVGEIVATRLELSESSAKAARDIYLAEKQLVDRDVEDIPALGEGTSESADDAPLLLTALRECSGVNALAERQEILFNPRMTVLFGENATGKTGYVRVLKRLANVRSSEPIIPDIHRPGVTATPEATIHYKLGDEEHERAWHGEEGVSPFTRMTVFDNPAATLHLEGDITYIYTPADLALFKHVNAAITGVRTLLAADVASRQPSQNPFLEAFTRGSSIFPKIEMLDASTDLVELEELATVSEVERAELATLKLSVETLSDMSNQSRGETLRNWASILRNLITIAEALERFQSQRYTDAVTAESHARDEQTSAAADVFGGGQLPDELRPAWQAFIEAGEVFLAADGQTEYPTVDDACIYCQQALDDAARNLLATYRDYANGTATAAVEAAAAEVDRFQALLSSAEVADALEELRVTLPTVEEGEQAPDWAAQGRRLLKGVREAHEAVIGRKPVDVTEAVVVSRQISSRLSVALADAKTDLRALEGDASERDQVLTEKCARLATLEARITLSSRIPDIRSYVKNAQWVDRLKTLMDHFQGLLKSLTEASKVASEELLNRDFEKAFYKECKLLRAPKVKLDFPGRRGEAARRKTVAAEHSIAEILSEGEQKIIAIADFLAETSLRSGSAPVIFDDPVTSFDYRRIREIAKRIASVAEEQQVIVFTHNIWFVSELLMEFENRPQQCTYYQVGERDGSKGIITRAIDPRFDNPTKIRGRINKAIQDAGAVDEAERQERIDFAYADIRAWCETVVEDKLLARVTLRHQPNVAMQNLRRIKTTHLQVAIDIIFPIWEKANRYITAHSQPPDTLGIRPNLDELEYDWATLQAALKAYDAGNGEG